MIINGVNVTGHVLFAQVMLVVSIFTIIWVLGSRAERSANNRKANRKVSNMIKRVIKNIDEWNKVMFICCHTCTDVYTTQKPRNDRIPLDSNQIVKRLNALGWGVQKKWGSYDLENGIALCPVCVKEMIVKLQATAHKIELEIQEDTE